MTIRLVGAREIRTMLGPVSRRRAYKLMRHNDFPPPAAALAQGRVWPADEVAAWIAGHRGGPPA